MYQAQGGVILEDKYYIVNKKVLPSVFEKVIAAKKLLLSDKCKTVNDAVNVVGISRSAFYKYKDNVSVYVDNSSSRILNINVLLTDKVGFLSSLLTLLSNFGVSILTINQNIPTEDVAPVTISMSVENMTCSVDVLLQNIKNAEGVLRVDLITKN